MFNIKKYNEINNLIRNQGKSTKIIAISKNHQVSKIEAAVSHGLKIFGENRVQEAGQKFDRDFKIKNSIKLHLTGPLQTNKVKQALEIFDVFHTLDREKLVKEFSKYPNKLQNKSFFIQVNTGKELTKSGIFPEQTKGFIKFCHAHNIKNLLGLMCIPPINESPKKHFELLEGLSKDSGLGGLSIGMSSDYLDALSFNPMYIRLGTILFGNRE